MNNKNRTSLKYPLRHKALLLVMPLVYSCFAHAAPEKGSEQVSERIYSPVARHADTATNLYFGDLHLHTNASADAYSQGAVLSRDVAYRFARGEQMESAKGMAVKLRRPLDFLAVTDHAEYMGVIPRIEAGDERLTKGWDVGERWAGYFESGEETLISREFGQAVQSDDPALRVPDDIAATIWEETADTADRFYEPGKFTTLIGYEWTSMVSGDNLHRVVLYRDAKDLATQALPFTAQHSTDPERLWEALERYEKQTGGSVLAIAHNGNVSNGRMFAPVTLSGQPLTADYASTRMRWEPVYEVTQIKGDGETHPALSPDDEFADFETWDQGNIIMTADKKPEMLPYEYARSALQQGLRYEEDLGVNPFKFGMIGSTDAHTSLSTAEEDNFFGKFANSEPSEYRTGTLMAGRLNDDWMLGASGLAAVWAPENTREALFAALKRREVYATTGPRMQVRFFGGWDFESTDVQRPDYAAVGYEKGVPMGGDLTRASGDKAPTFMIAAARDPDGANLDRVQVIKGWLDSKGQTHEKVHDVALSDDRQVDPKTGKAPAVGNTIDLKSASYLNSIGDAELATVWTDPEFDPEQRAFYYVRVLEIPTPRWPVYDAHHFGNELEDKVWKTLQERAYTSPIWYTP